MSAYLDASILLSRTLDETASPAVDRFIEGTSLSLMASDFAVAEASSGVSRLVRIGALAANDARALLRDLDGWRAVTTSPVELASSDVRLADTYVRQFDLMLRAPDALHIAIAYRLGSTLITLDQRMATAAATLGVAVLNPAV